MLLVIFLSTPSARRATSYLPGTAIVDLFLSTPSARRATPARARLQLPAQISIHALREEGDVYFRSEYTATSGISIHALCEEGDVSTLELYLLMQFLSTPSARRAT